MADDQTGFPPAPEAQAQREAQVLVGAAEPDGDDQAATLDQPDDEVDAAGKGSFPASDPPAWTPVTGVRVLAGESTD